MSNDKEAAKAYGQVLLDAVSAFRDDESGKTMELASKRALELNILGITMDDDDVATVDISDVIGPSVILAQILVDLAASGRYRDADSVISDARQVLSDALDSTD